MTEKQQGDSQATLADVLYAKCPPPVDERAWAMLVRSIADGDQLALHALYDMAHHLVFTLSVRIVANRETAEEVTVDVFHGIWRGAAGYDAARGTVLGWIMNQTRSRAVDRLRLERRKKRTPGDCAPSSTEEVIADADDLLELRQQGALLREALAALSPGERQAIETTFLAGLTHAEAAERLNEPLGTIKTRIRSGLLKLRDRLSTKVGEP